MSIAVVYSNPNMTGGTPVSVVLYARLSSRCSFRRWYARRKMSRRSWGFVQRHVSKAAEADVIASRTSPSLAEEAFHRTLWWTGETTSKVVFVIFWLPPIHSGTMDSVLKAMVIFTCLNSCRTECISFLIVSITPCGVLENTESSRGKTGRCQ
ncbi:hypothetical protein BDW59DRAFT_138274 [Aspergillus cavernicola]|uniref:Uncharacterized protein n=1 Tax=Aspergillus cavernicola TaxID=176166 RepID=A0ABR4J231_9EURO